jgi:hypothetical protein
MSPVTSSWVVAVVVSKLPGLPTLCSLVPQSRAPVSCKPAAVVLTGTVHIDLNTKHHIPVPNNIYITYVENLLHIKNRYYTSVKESFSYPLLPKEMP